MLRGIRTGRSSDASTQIGISMEAGRWRLEAFIILTHAVEMFSVTRPVLMHFPPNNYTEQIYGIYFLDFWHANEPAHLLLTKRTSTEHTNNKIILFYLRHTARRCSGSAAPEMISLPPTLLIRAQTVPRHPEIWTKVVVIQKTLFCSFLGKSQEAWSVCTLHNKVTSGKFGNFC